VYNIRAISIATLVVFCFKAERNQETAPSTGRHTARKIESAMSENLRSVTATAMSPEESKSRDFICCTLTARRHSTLSVYAMALPHDTRTFKLPRMQPWCARPSHADRVNNRPLGEERGEGSVKT
jgi:hypothetical protein